MTAPLRSCFGLPTCISQWEFSTTYGDHVRDVDRPINRAPAPAAASSPDVALCRDHARVIEDHDTAGLEPLSGRLATEGGWELCSPDSIEPNLASLPGPIGSSK